MARYYAVTGVMEELFLAGPQGTYRDFIIADGHMVAERIGPANWNTLQWGRFDWGASVTMYYFTPDHLGSISVIADSTGAVLERDSYDAWGKRRNIDGTPAACGTVNSSTTRGFTGQEMMDGVCTVNFNARVYDPSLGRFMSADPTTQMPYNLQDLNRYSYVLNNPLSLTDPNGLCFLGCFWRNPIFDAILDIALVFVGLPWLDELTGLVDLSAGSAGLFGAFLSESTAVAALNAGIAGGIVGFAATGKLGGALISAASAAAFAGLVPGTGGAGTAAGEFGNLVGHAATDFIVGGLIGGLTSVAEGGRFASGFLSGGVGSLAGPLTGGGFSPQGAVASVVLGGFASELGGGKFANGAITGAFAYAAESEAAGNNGPQSANANSSQPEVGKGLGGFADILGKLWALPDTIIGLSLGLPGYGLSQIAYQVGWQVDEPDILLLHNAIEFTYNSVAFLGGAITFGNVEIFGYSQDDIYGEGAGQIGWQHEWAHTIQAEILGPLYLPPAGLSLGLGEIFNGDSHGPASFMEVGPTSNPPRPWPW